MIEESKCFSDVMKNHFMTKKDNKDFENLTKYWICDSYYADGHIV